MGTLLVLALGLAPADAGPAQRPTCAARADAAAMCLDPDGVVLVLDRKKMIRAGISMAELDPAVEGFFQRRRALGLAELRALRVKGHNGALHRLGDFATVTLRAGRR
jgi:hypothetical protein